VGGNVNGVLPLQDSLTVVLIFVAEISGSSGVSIVNIPFGFRAAQRELKPGRYVLHLIDEGVLGLRAVDTSVLSECRIVRVETASPSQKGTLVFVEQDGGYVLTKAFWPKTAIELSDPHPALRAALSQRGNNILKESLTSAISDQQSATSNVLLKCSL
jgi:hypothetical protein